MRIGKKEEGKEELLKAAELFKKQNRIGDAKRVEEILEEWGE